MLQGSPGHIEQRLVGTVTYIVVAVYLGPATINGSEEPADDFIPQTFESFQVRPQILCSRGKSLSCALFEFLV